MGPRVVARVGVCSVAGVIACVGACVAGPIAPDPCARSSFLTAPVSIDAKTGAPLPIKMPARCAIEGALVATDFPPRDFGDHTEFAALDAVLNGAVVTISRGLPAQTSTLCLGEADFGRPLSVRLRTVGFSEAPNAAVVIHASCVAPGTVVQPSTNEPGAWIAAGVVDDGAFAIDDGAIHLSGASTHTEATVLGPEIGALSLRAGHASALRVRVLGTNQDGGGVRVLLEEQEYAELRARLEPYQVCLPPSLAGQVAKLGFRLHGGIRDAEQDVTIGDLSLVDDDGCDAAIVDGSFEQRSPTWLLTNATIAAGPSGAEAELRARGQSDAELATVVSVPVPDDAGGPAFVFRYRYADDAGATTFTAHANGQTSTNLPASAGTTATVCIAPARAGERLKLFWSLARAASSASSVDAFAAVDDVAVETNAACPSR